MAKAKWHDTDGDAPHAGPKEHSSRHGIHRDLRGEDQPADKSRAQQTSTGEEAQRDAARDQPPSPGQPAHGE